MDKSITFGVSANRSLNVAYIDPQTGELGPPQPIVLQSVLDAYKQETAAQFSTLMVS